MTRQYRGDSSEAVCVLNMSPSRVYPPHIKTHDIGDDPPSLRYVGYTVGHSETRARAIAPSSIDRSSRAPHLDRSSTTRTYDDDVCPSARVYPRGDADRDRTSRRERHDARERRAPELVPRLRRPRVLGWIVAVVRCVWCGVVVWVNSVCWVVSRDTGTDRASRWERARVDG